MKLNAIKLFVEFGQRINKEYCERFVEGCKKHVLLNPDSAGNINPIIEFLENPDNLEVVEVEVESDTGVKTQMLQLKTVETLLK